MEYCKKPFKQNECKDNKCPVRHICDYYIRQKQITLIYDTGRLRYPLYRYGNA